MQKKIDYVERRLSAETRGRNCCAPLAAGAAAVVHHSRSSVHARIQIGAVSARGGVALRLHALEHGTIQSSGTRGQAALARRGGLRVGALGALLRAQRQTVRVRVLCKQCEVDRRGSTRKTVADSGQIVGTGKEETRKG